MSSIMQILRRIGGAKMPPTSGSAGQLAMWKAGTAPTDAASLYAHDGTQWKEMLDTSAQWTVTGADVYRAAGKVGIGTAAPAVDLEVHGPTATIQTTGVTTLLSASGSTSGTVQVVNGANYCNFAINAAKAEIGSSGAPLSVGTSTAHSLHFGTNNTTRVTVDATTGNVGIGTETPTTPLEVSGPNGAIVVTAPNAVVGIHATATATLQIKSGAKFSNFAIDATSTSLSCSAGPMTIGPSGADYLDLKTGSSRWMRIDGSGTIIMNSTGIGVSEAGADVGATLYPGGIFGVHATNDRVMFVRRSGSDGVLVNLLKNTASVGTISVAGATVSYNTSSDYRLKEDVKPVQNAIDRLNALKPVNFAWKVNGERVDGFIAHEVQAVIPEAVTGAKDAVDADGNPIYQGIDQAKLVPLLTAALQDALKRIEALEARL